MNDYLSDIFENIGIDESIKEVELNLPIAYQKKYILAEINFDNERFLLVKENRRGVLENFVKQAEFISREYQGKYILIFNKISDDEKKLLLRARIPFIDYRGNMFIPKLGLILNKEIEKLKNKQFTASEQLIFTYILVTGLDYGDRLEVDKVVEKTKLSIATVYRVLKKFVHYDWIHTEHGTYRIGKDVATMFLAAQDYLFNPIKKSVYVDQRDFKKIQKNKKIWGYTGAFALGKMTHLLEEDIAIAMSASDVYQLIEEADIQTYESKLFWDKNMIELEIWHYQPIVKNEMVDTISLYMTLKDTEDPRIEKELQKIIKKLKNNI